MQYVSMKKVLEKLSLVNPSSEICLKVKSILNVAGEDKSLRFGILPAG